MRIRYKIKNIIEYKNSGLSFNEEKYYNRWSILPENFHLTYNKDYTVYGIEYLDEQEINFMIKDDTGVIYPKFFPSSFFEIIDSRLSRYFIGTSEKQYPIKDIKYPAFISYKEIVLNGFFYDDFIECKNEANQIFEKYKDLIDNEFPSSELKDAELIENNWVFCCNCDESFEVKYNNGIIICPNCKHKCNNPLFGNEIISFRSR